MTIFAIGDSHSIFFHNSPVVKEHWVSFANLPLTWYRLLNEGLDIYNIGTKLGNGHEKYNIKSGDHVMFCYGWNDIQKNIYNHAKDNYKEEIEKLSSKYIDLLLKYKEKYKIIPIVQCIYPNPLKTGDSKGSPEERKKYTEFANCVLRKLCQEKNVFFFDNYDLITDENGFIKKEYTKDKVHLDYTNKFLREKIDNMLVKISCYYNYPFKPTVNLEEN